jgi:hypothetical protein
MREFFVDMRSSGDYAGMGKNNDGFSSGSGLLTPCIPKPLFGIINYIIRSNWLGL